MSDVDMRALASGAPYLGAIVGGLTRGAIDAAARHEAEAARFDIEARARGYVPERTCRMVRETGIKYKFRCTACEDTTYEDEPFYCKRYCPNCGAKVVK